MKKEIMETILFSSLGLNIILLLTVLSPNLVYLIHKKWFKWRK
jgi:hypothetical protein